MKTDRHEGVRLLVLLAMASICFSIGNAEDTEVAAVRVIHAKELSQGFSVTMSNYTTQNDVEMQHILVTAKDVEDPEDLALAGSAVIERPVDSDEIKIVAMSDGDNDVLHLETGVHCRLLCSCRTMLDVFFEHCNGLVCQACQECYEICPGPPPPPPPPDIAMCANSHGPQVLSHGGFSLCSE